MSDREPYPSEKQDRFIVRLPDGMRDRIKHAAEANNRSMNAEIVARLTESLERERLLNTPMPGGGLFGLGAREVQAEPLSPEAMQVIRVLIGEIAKAEKK